ncbi:hypothetical protein [Microvirga tunisiensis]|uniref:Uncharacterized protein n=1 Tax=Microvirga tunisiensis TaxID=2108360 RepID=A0A5N7MQF0_9HYPH|nr:hypothetical protein [Microvirga tunisiensis]MPR10487.1 hypothetical protein [Microvirga tunisiensis]MPR28679.1 hypothetical protein [Microvirga tunisiensis]
MDVPDGFEDVGEGGGIEIDVDKNELPKSFFSSVPVDPGQSMRHIRLLFEKLVLPLQEKGDVEVVIDVRAKSNGGYDPEVVSKIQEAVKSLKIETAHFED